jgi:hypothetical protein
MGIQDTTCQLLVRPRVVSSVEVGCIRLFHFLTMVVGSHTSSFTVHMRAVMICCHTGEHIVRTLALLL